MILLIILIFGIAGFCFFGWLGAIIGVVLGFFAIAALNGM